MTYGKGDAPGLCLMTGEPHRPGTGRDKHECADCDELLCSIPHPHPGSDCEVRGTGGFVTWDQVPRKPWSYVAANIWLGGSLFGVPTSADFDYVLTLWRRAKPARVRHEERWCFPDTEVPRADELAHFADLVTHLARQGDRVLVRCQLGLNRSALVVATGLVRWGADPQETINTLRARRSPYVLCNPTFEAYVLQGARV